MTLLAYLSIFLGLFLKENALGNLFYNPAERGEADQFSNKECEFLNTLLLTNCPDWVEKEVSKDEW
jgi:hypothetical protein